MAAFTRTYSVVGYWFNSQNLSLQHFAVDAKLINICKYGF